MRGSLNIMTFLLFCVLLIAVTSPTVKKHSFERKFWFAKKLDDTDNFTTGARSNMALYIDHGTGVHYLKTPFGSLVPRLKPDGSLVKEYQQPHLKDKQNDQR